MLIDLIDSSDGKIYINGTKKVLTPLTNEKGLKKRFNKIVDEFNSILIIFIEANGYTLKELDSKKTDLNDIFSSNEYYEKFITKYISMKKSIENAQYISENPIYLQRKLDSDLNELKELISKLYPEYKPKYKVSKWGNLFSNFIKKTFLFSILFFFLGFLGLAFYILVQELLIRI